jgi:hypothetical protein
MADAQLPGVFGDVQPLLEQYGYLGVGGMLFLEDFGFERYKWYVIGMLAVVVAIVITHRVRRRRAERPA